MAVDGSDFVEMNFFRAGRRGRRLRLSPSLAEKWRRRLFSCRLRIAWIYREFPGIGGEAAVPGLVPRWSRGTKCGGTFRFFHTFFGCDGPGQELAGIAGRSAAVPAGPAGRQPKSAERSCSPLMAWT